MTVNGKAALVAIGVPGIGAMIGAVPGIVVARAAGGRPGRLEAGSIARPLAYAGIGLAVVGSFAGAFIVARMIIR